MNYIIQVRKYYSAFTQSKLYMPNVEGRFCYVLEDQERPQGIKVDGKTCVPEGIFDVTISMSTRFKKEMLLIYNQPDFSIQKYGIRFDGVRPHGGNTVEDTEGCPLCAYDTDDKGTVSRRASDDIFNIVKTKMLLGEKFKWIITS